MMSYLDVTDFARHKESNLTYDDFTNQVHWMHVDGSRGCWVRSFVSEVDDEWIIIYTENHGCFIYHKKDLLEVIEFNLENNSVTSYIELQEHNSEENVEIEYTDED
jgi:hypothetical protein